MSSDPAHAAAPKGLLLKADTISAPFQAEVQHALAARPRAPKLVGILATSSAPSRSYAEFTRRQCAALGFEFVLREVGAACAPAEEGGERGGEGEGVEDAIIEANADESVDGTMVRQPLLCVCALRSDFLHHVFFSASGRMGRCAMQVYYPIFGAQQVCSVRRAVVAI